ncbi:NUDIX hydrolase [Candidatus Microgenomates bacterium]|nr:NUDIX hydrolase [Candidatus Microgenomates bacterium]
MKKKQNNPKFLVVARGIIKRNDGKILLLKRNNKHMYYPNKWELPGGRLAGDTDPHISLGGIIHKECGLITDVRSKKFYSYSRLVSEPSKYQGYVYVEITSEADLIGGTEKVDKTEHSQFVWIDSTAALSYDLTFESKKAIASYVADHSGLQTENGVVLVARALIKDKKGRFLFLKRSSTESYSQMWELPGGKFDSLEILPELIKREVFEETGLAVRITNEALYLSSQISTKGDHKGSTFINIIGEAEIAAGKVELTTEHNDFGWFTKEQIFKLNLAPYLRIPLTEIFLKA